MAGVNKVIIVGRLGTDPKVKSFDSGDKIVEFPVATSEKYTDKNGQPQEQTEWHNIVIRRERLVGLAEQYLKKGSQIYLEGRLRTRSWDDQAGAKHYRTEILMDNMTFVGSAPGGQGNNPPSYSESQPSRASEPQQPPIGDIDDDLPF
jgi:single-strand DNA-binding protein